MFEASLIIVAALIYFAVLAMTLAYVAGVTRSGKHREHAPKDLSQFHPHDEHVRRAA